MSEDASFTMHKRGESFLLLENAVADIWSCKSRQLPFAPTGAQEHL